MNTFRHQRGFTLIEILIVIGIIAILAAVVIVAINPARQFDQANDTARRSDLTELLSAISRERIDKKGVLNPAITTTRTEICKTGAASCTNLIDLTSLTVNAIYIDAMPIDPECPDGCAANGTGYFVVKNANKTVTVDAFLHNALASISFTQ